jgi:hypothetical protein
MAEMRASVSTIAVLGVLSFALIAVGMLWSLSALEQTPAGNRAKLANQIREAFRLEGVRVDREIRNGRETIIVTFETEVPLHDKPTELESQLSAIAVFVWQKCDEKDKEEVDRVLVVRQEIRESGCDREVLRDEYKSKNPDIERFFRE